MKRILLIGLVACVSLVFAASAFARDARLDYLVKQGRLTEEDIAAAEMEGPSNVMSDPSYDVYISGLIQPWFRWIEDADNEYFFDLHRTRLRVDGLLGDNWGFAVQTEWICNVSLLDTGVWVNVGDGKIKVGQWKLPLVLENITSAGTLDTILRSNIASIVDRRDIGVFLDYPFLEGQVGLQASVTNGTGLNASEENDDKDYTIRVAAKPFQGSEGPADGLLIAGAYNMGDQQELDANGVDLGDFTRTRWVGTVQWVWNEIKVQGEYINIDQDVSGGGSTETDGWYALASYSMPMDMMTVTPVVKYETLDNVQSGNWITLGVCLSFVGINDVKLEANYILEDLDEGEDADEFILQLTANF